MSAKSKKKSTTLGKSLLKDKYGKKSRNSSTMLHTSEVFDGQDWTRLNAKSITEQSHVEDLLDLAELAGTQFKAEKLNIKFISSATKIGILSEAEKRKISKAQDTNRDLLKIPRRPAWDKYMTAEELALAERDSFLKWRRTLLDLQDIDGIILTPYEKNLDFWRQLWRVVERSDVVVQIVDGRNPLLFYSPDLSQYVKEIGPRKENLILINKADFLTETQRKYWFEYFSKLNIKVVFFSALEETLPNIEEKEEEPLETDEPSEEESNLDCSVNSEEIDSCLKDLEQLQILSASNKEVTTKDTNEETKTDSGWNILSYSELEEFFKSYLPNVNNDHVIIGLVGYPNVGKSSTINRLLKEKKVSVSATPGKTKHFQTLFLSDEVLLCDCPGLVFPAFVSSKEEMILCGILPIDQLRDHVPPMNLLLSLIPRSILEDTYGINIPPPRTGEDPNRCPISEEFLNSYGYMRGFMTPRGIPDHPRAARYVLKDFMNGKILFCYAPPNIPQDAYHNFVVEKVRNRAVKETPHQKSAMMRKFDEAETLDREFFQDCKMHIKGQSTAMPTNPAKPWRVKPDRTKHVKARNKYAHLDYK